MLLAPVWIPLAVLVAVLAVIVYPFTRARLWMLRRAFRKKWGPAGRDILLIYSNSPNWQEYIEQNWLPHLDDRTVLLNWSERAQWREKHPLEAKLLRAYLGDREFNPAAVYIPDRGRVRVIRFWQAFRDFKHGREALLRRQEATLFTLIDRTRAAA
ncbi:MAG TPA: hypothetical protein VGA37_06070 [Gemmatimonadales bacterium]